MRIDGRALDELRSVKFTPDFTKFAEGSCLVEMGDTVVLCNASVEEKLPPHVRSGGWITAEYSMLPRANRERSKRDIAKLKLNGRSAEIQRLIGRSLRSAVDLSAMEGVSIVVDCDVLQGDGGTRTASVTGGFVALVIALRKLVAAGKLEKLPVSTFVAWSRMAAAQPAISSVVSARALLVERAARNAAFWVGVVSPLMISFITA